MARALDAGSDDAFTGRTSELRGKETDPQPDRVGFEPNTRTAIPLRQQDPVWSISPLVGKQFADPRGAFV